MSAPLTTQGHVPVLIDRVIAALAPQAGETMVDGHPVNNPCDNIDKFFD